MPIMPIAVFLVFVLGILWLSFYLARKTASAASYYAAGGQIHWAVNGIAFAGDYLSAASFLGICGMIATFGYDGFLYSIGYLAGWIVALFVVAEPMKRLGKYTFTDALDSKFSSRGIQLAAGISTLIVSGFYLIPQMVGAGALVRPLLGLPNAAGVTIVGAIVITIVATAGMRSTTYVQFIKGGLLVLFSTIVVLAVCWRGLKTEPEPTGAGSRETYPTMAVTRVNGTLGLPAEYELAGTQKGLTNASYYKLKKGEMATWWMEVTPGAAAGAPQNRQAPPGDAAGTVALQQLPALTVGADGSRWINGRRAGESEQLQLSDLVKVQGKTGAEAQTGPLNPLSFLARLDDPGTIVRRWKKETTFTDAGYQVTLFSPVLTPGDKIMRPGLFYKLEGNPTDSTAKRLIPKLDFVSLMLALFCGTAALPHILIRYYTVSSPVSARKSTIVAIAAIGAFYVLTLFLGLGAMVNGVIDPTDSNMAAPLLARSFGMLLFALISAIAFATVLGTVSGLIVAASGAVAHDLLDRYSKLELNDRQKVAIGKAAAVMIGFLAIILGIVFQGMNVSFLVGLAFAVAASANLPAIIMLLFWKRTTAAGIVASILVGVVSSVALIALSPDLYTMYGLDPNRAPMPLKNPGIISIPLSFVTLVVVSLLTTGWARKTAARNAAAGI